MLGPVTALEAVADRALVLVAWSASKTFTHYGLRVGALVALVPDAAERARVARGPDVRVPRHVEQLQPRRHGGGDAAARRDAAARGGRRRARDPRAPAGRARGRVQRGRRAPRAPPPAVRRRLLRDGLHRRRRRRRAPHEGRRGLRRAHRGRAAPRPLLDREGRRRAPGREAPGPRRSADNPPIIDRRRSAPPRGVVGIDGGWDPGRGRRCPPPCDNRDAVRSTSRSGSSPRLAASPLVLASAPSSPPSAPPSAAGPRRQGSGGPPAAVDRGGRPHRRARLGRRGR